MNIEPFEHNMPEYEDCFEQHGFVYEAELHAVRALLPPHGVGIEIGIGDRTIGCSVRNCHGH